MAEQPGHRSTQRHLDASTNREVVYCHQCDNEWYRDEQGLICPRCDGEATEIVSADNDPRSMDLTGSQSDELRNLQHHNPWPDDEVPDPEEGDVEQYVTHGPNHTMYFSSHTIRPGDFARGMERDAPNPNEPSNVIRDFQSMMGNFMGPGLRQGQAGRSGPDALFQGGGNNPFNFPPLGSGRTGGPHVTGGRFTFTTATGPRNPDGPQPRGAPVEDLATYAPPSSATSPSGPTVLFISIRARPDQLVRLLGGLFGAMGPMGEMRGLDGQQNGLPGLQGFVASLLNPAGAVVGDAVYTQEALDRIVSTLMEQHPTSNAPGPASASAIAALPKKKLDERMLDSELKADCSVCMDDVFLGDEVVVLPCTHWFHETCASAWLSEHNTCPICRTSISDDLPNANPGNETPAYNTASRPGQENSPVNMQTSERRQSELRQASDNGQARLQAIRAAAGVPTTSTGEDGPRRYHIIGDSSRSSPPSQPQMAGAYESSRGVFGRRASSLSDSQSETRGGPLTRRTSSSRGSLGSNNGNGGANGPFSWFRRFSGGGNR